ncbi:NADPH oxidase activator 1 isoform X2 [Ascaphus truei]|uniref:NADPH oxidase activator 1 isoform X2 n=1 Tax=Ascaphus truei TaxID=8439 RepID=UPI003F59934F
MSPEPVPCQKEIIQVGALIPTRSLVVEALVCFCFFSYSQKCRMPYKDVVKFWHEGVLAAEKKDFDLALKNFTSIEDPPSKIWFNIGCIHLLKGELQEALEAYNKSIIKDHFLAVGFFQRSYIYFQLEKYEKALSDLHLALAQLRDNSVIDYKQLGLRHLLYNWEVLYNSAVMLCYLEKWQSAEEKLKEALNWLPGDGKNDRLDVALDHVQRHVLLQPVHVPDGELFRPRKQEVEQLNSKDFLGKPKVISSVVPNDEFSGFAPLRPQKPAFYEPCREAMQGRDAGYHRVVEHYYPEKSNEVAIKANSVLFVLNKEGDWATAIHDGQKILIPTYLLEPVNAPKADMKKINNGIPLPPMKMPPTRPNIERTLGSSPRSYSRETQCQIWMGYLPNPRGIPPEPFKLKTVTFRAEPMVEKAVPLQSSSHMNQETILAELEPIYEDVAQPALDDLIVLQVHSEFTVAMTVNKDITFPELQTLLRDKLRQRGEQIAIQLSFRDSDGKGLTPVQSNGDLQRMWQHAKDKRLMLCCKDADHCVGRPILYRMIALYEYPAEGPEDLKFTQGDIITILSEVNEEWLEGHCNGNIGIFPKCFASYLDGEQKP